MAGHSSGDTAALYNSTVLMGALNADGAETNEKGGAIIGATATWASSRWFSRTRARTSSA